MDGGTRLARAAGEIKGEVVSSVVRVTDLIAAIAAASREQSDGLSQVNSAVVQMDLAVQENASLVEQAAAATDTMRSHAHVLIESISRFRLQDEDRPGQPVAALGAVARRRRPSAATGARLPALEA